jgi:phage terminase large subunit
VYVLNEWGKRSTATVFHNLVVEDFEVREADLSNRRFGMDFGYNHANALMGVGFKDGELYVWYELYAKHQQNADFIEAAKQSELPMDYTIKADSAEPDKIAQWIEAGYDRCHKVEKGPHSVMRQVDYLKALPKIHVHASRCPNAAREFARFSYRQMKDGRILDNEFVEIDDDTVAAVRYAIEDLLIERQHSSGYFIKRRML